MARPSSRTPYLLVALVAGAALGATAAVVGDAVLGDGTTTVVRQVTVSDSEPAARGGGLSIPEIAERSLGSVVEITAGSSDSFGATRQRAQGSGFVYDREGHIVTNQHVVGSSSSITVRFPDGSTYEARLVGLDRSTDLAVLKVDVAASVLEPVRFADSSAARVGDPVVAMGSPFGLEGTVTSGIVSALHRQMTAPNGFSITDSIQTDAAINHGNSGGPLLDAEGRLLGVNTQIESDSGGSDGVGFAIPSNTVRAIVEQLIERGEVLHAYLGVTMVEVPRGVAVTEVRSGAPAEKAGVRAATGTETVNGQEIPTGGDVIVAFDGAAVTSAAQLQSAVDSKRPGDVVSLTVLRNGQRVTLDVTLAERPS